MKLAILNTAICTTYGKYSYEPCSLATARQMAATAEIDSAVGHEATAQILSDLLGVDVLVRRIEFRQNHMDRR